MCKICPKCGAIAEYNAYYGRTTCTRCEWESEEQQKKYSVRASSHHKKQFLVQTPKRAKA